MAKWCGIIGYADNVEVEPGVYADEIVEKSYFGDLTRNTRKLQNSGEINDNINISNELSIVADPYAINNFYKMRYAYFRGIKWKVTDVEVQYPRLVLTLGGVWTENESTTTE